MVLMFNTVLMLQIKHNTIIRVCRSTPRVKFEIQEAGCYGCSFIPAFESLTLWWSSRRNLQNKANLNNDGEDSHCSRCFISVKISVTNFERHEESVQCVCVCVCVCGCVCLCSSETEGSNRVTEQREAWRRCLRPV